MDAKPLKVAISIPNESYIPVQAPAYSILLNDGSVTFVDKEDLIFLTKYKWLHHPSGYATRAQKRNGKWKTVYLHKEIIKIPRGFETDHINRNRLDNRKSNLRVVKRYENCHNRKMRSDNTSGVFGVFLEKNTGKWIGRITINGKRQILGRFFTKEEAGMAYKLATQRFYEQNCL